MRQIIVTQAKRLGVKMGWMKKNFASFSLTEILLEFGTKSEIIFAFNSRNCTVDDVAHARYPSRSICLV